MSEQCGMKTNIAGEETQFVKYRLLKIYTTFR